MNSELITELFQICIFPLLAILTAFVVSWLKMKMGEIAAKQENELAQKYINMLTDTVTNCVIAVNQTYVDALKKKGEFGIEAQKEAFTMVYKQVLANLQGEAYTYLNEIYSDLDEYIKTLIEAQVRLNKIEKSENE